MHESIEWKCLRYRYDDIVLMRIPRDIATAVRRRTTGDVSRLERKKKEKKEKDSH